MKTTTSRAWSIGALYLLAAISNQIVSQASTMPDLSSWTWVQWMALINAIALTIRSYIDRTPAQITPALEEWAEDAGLVATQDRGTGSPRNLPPDPPLGTVAGLGSRYHGGP